MVIGVAAAAYTIYNGIQLVNEQSSEYDLAFSDDEEAEIDSYVPPQPVTHRRQTGPRFCTHPPVTRCESPPRLVHAPPRRRRRDRARDALASADGRLRRGMHKVKKRLLAVNRRYGTEDQNDGVHDVGEDEEEGGASVCVVDLEPIRPGQRAVRLPCLHEFHADCILPYLANMNEPCCPIDRCPVPRNDVPLLPVWTVTA